MADRYWVGGSGTWSSANTANWASTSGGSGGQSVPTTNDAVIIDSNSDNGAAFTITVANANQNCASFIATPDQVCTLVRSGSSSQITCAGSFDASDANMRGDTSTSAGSLLLLGTGNHTLGFNGATHWEPNINSNGGTYKLISNWTRSGSRTFTVTRGTFDTDGYNITTNAFIITGTFTKTIYFRTSTITLELTSARITANATNTTLDAGTSSITVNGSGSTVSMSGLTLHNLTIQVNYVGAPEIQSAVTVNDLTIANDESLRHEDNELDIALGITVTVNGTFTSLPNANNRAIRTIIRSSSNLKFASAYAVLNAAAVSLRDTDFHTITLGGGATWSGTSIGRGGFVSGLTETTPKTVYWRGSTGTRGPDDANQFSATSGAAGADANYPLPQDTVIVDNNCLATQIDFGTVEWFIGKLDFSARTTSINLSMTADLNVSRGGFILSSSVVFISGSTIRFWDSGELNTAGTTIPINFVFYGDDTSSPLGAVKLLSNVSISGTRTWQLQSGTLDLDGYTLTVNSADIFSASNTTGVQARIRLNGGKLVFNSATVNYLDILQTASNFQFIDPQNGSIQITGTFATGAINFGSVTITGGFPEIIISTTTDTRFISTANQSFHDFTNTVTPFNLTFSTGRTFTFDDFNLSGTAGNLGQIGFNNGGVYTFSKASGIVSVDYLNLIRSTATGGAAWYAGANSTDSGTNTGWIFTAAPKVITGNNVTQNATSGTGAIVVIAEVILTGNNVTQDATSGTGAIAIEYNLAGNSVTQNATSGTGAINVQSSLAGNDVTQTATSGTGAISVEHNLAGSNATQSTVSTAGAVVLVNNLAANNAQQNANSGVGSITLGPILTGNNAIQLNQATAGAIEVIIKARAPDGAGYAPLRYTVRRPIQAQYKRPGQTTDRRR